MRKSVTFFVIFFLLFWLTSAGNTPYNYFTRLADGFIHGRLYLTEAPPWLSELVPAGPNKFYVVQPPMPALLAIPFVALFGIDFPQQIIAHIIGALISVVTMNLAIAITKKEKVGLFMGILGAVGTIMWYEAATGSVWYLGQITAALFLLLGIYEVSTKKRPFFVGAAVGAAYLCRIHTVLSLPFFAWAIKDSLFEFQLKPLRLKKIYWKNIFLFASGGLIFFGFDVFYNMSRWGTIWDNGYFLIPGILNEPWFSKGMLNVAYIPDHLSLLFLKLPNFLPNPPYIEPSWFGLSIFLTTPVFIYSVLAPIKNALVRLSWVSILLIFIVVALRGGTGWTQFGYRYAVDFYAFLIYLTILSIKKTGLTKIYWVLLVIGIIVNFWGVLWINKFGWVNF